MSGLNQHTANVPNRKVPKVRNRLQRAQKPSLHGLCRASGDSQRNPSASALWLVSSVGSEHDATNVGVGSSSLSRVTTLEVYCTGLENRQTATSQRFQSFSLRKLALSHNGSAADSGSASGGSIPSGATSVRSFGRLGVCAGLKIPKTWFESTRLHLKNRECCNGNEGGLEFLELAKKSAF